MACKNCHSVMAEILNLQSKMNTLVEKLNKCDCLDCKAEPDPNLTCEPCLYFANQIDYCWLKNIYKHPENIRCKKFEDYEEWFKIHGISQENR